MARGIVKYCYQLNDVIESKVHTETFSFVFVLFQVMSWLFSITLRTVNNSKTKENVFVCTEPYSPFDENVSAGIGHACNICFAVVIN